MFSRPLKIALPIGFALALLAAIMVVNARQSWRPVFVDFGHSSSSITPPPYFPVAWRGAQLWLLISPPLSNPRSAPTIPWTWKVARNWNHTSLPLICSTNGDGDIVALNPAQDDLARTTDSGVDTRIQISQSRTFFRALEDKGHRNVHNLMRPRRATLFSYSPDGTHLIANSELYGLSDANEVKKGFCTYGAVLFDARTGQQIKRQSAIEGCFTDFAWSPDSREVAGITADGYVFILNGVSGQLRIKFRAHQFFGAQIAWSPDGKTLVTATNPRVGWSPTRLSYDFKSGANITMGESGEGKATIGSGPTRLIIIQHFNGDATFNGRTERLLKRFDAHTGKQIGQSIPLQTGAVDLAFSPDGGHLALGEHNFALLLNADTLATERHLPFSCARPPKAPSDPVCVAWSPDSGTLATATWRGITLWRTR